MLEASVSRALHELTALKVWNASTGKYDDGGGLWLVKRDDGGGQWVQRVTVHGRRREMALDSLQDVSLKEARRLSEAARALIRQGKDPIKERAKRRREAATVAHTLADVTAECFEARKAQLKNDAKSGPLEWSTRKPRVARNRVGACSRD